MRVVVLGAGTVGTWIADLLCRDGHSVTIVDADAEKVRMVNDRLDVRSLTGSASQSSTLFQADVISADICLAVTGNDEVNLVGASMAKAMGARRSVARVYAPIFRDLSTFDYQRHFGIDRLLSLEQLTAAEFAREIRRPGSAVVDNFAGGELDMQEVIVDTKSRSTGKTLKDLDLPKGIRIGSIERDKQLWIAGAEDTVQADDHLTLIGRREEINNVREMFQKKPSATAGIVIAGGGETGYHLARLLQGDRYRIVMMEQDSDRCSYLAKSLPHVTVVQADANRRLVMEEERVGTADVFIACTGDDENNIMAGVEAREIGAKKIMAVVGRPDYANVVAKLGIDLAVSERKVVARQILGFLNDGAVVSRTTLPGNQISTFEIEVLKGVPATEHVLAKLPLPHACLIAAVMREDYVMVPGADDRLQAGDRVIALIDHSVVDDVLKQFST